MDEEKLILEVENHTILYDTSHPFYKDINRKEKTWGEVAEVLGVHADLCKTKWKALRDAFVKSRKKTKQPSGSAGGQHKEWKFEKIMSFLLPYIQPRSSRTNLVMQMEAEGEGSASGSEEPPVTTVETAASSPAPSLSLASSTERPSRSRSPRERNTAPTSQPSRDTRRASRQVDLGDRLLSLLQEPVPKPYMPDGELDESYHFAMSIVPMLHRLDKNKRQQAKMDILKTLYTLENSQAQIPAPTPPSVPPTPPPAWYPRPPPSTSTRQTSQAGRQMYAPSATATRAVGPFMQMLTSDPQQWEGEEGFYTNM